MKKICFITTISLTLKVFVIKTAEFIHENTDWDISFICSPNDEFVQSLPCYIHYYPVHMERGISIGGVRAMLEMKRIFEREKFDLVQYSTPNASLYAAMAGFLAKVPVRLYCQWGMVFAGFEGIKRKIFRAEEKLVCKLSTWIEPDSKSNLRFAQEAGLYPEEKSSVIWNGSACGVDLKKFDVEHKKEYREEIQEKLGIPKNSFVFGFVGRITRDKGVNELLKAFKMSGNNTYLVMVGPSEVDATISKELYDWSKSCNRVVYTGYTNAVEKYLAAMDCYILPSYREGFGMGVVEAEAMGLPVIVTDIPGPVDAMEHHKTGVIVPVKDEQALYSAMCWLMENPTIAQQYAEAGIAYVKERFAQNKLQQYILDDRIRLLKNQQEG
ncbi:glycosyltransferase [Blautia schinkii]|nr:glycosyltransferase [Blautia schinkii]